MPAIASRTQEIDRLAGQQQLLDLLVVVRRDAVKASEQRCEPAGLLADEAARLLDGGARRLEAGEPRHARLARHAAAIDIAGPGAAIEC